jgi:hypothetical protein
MNDPRRFNESEVREIFEDASRTAEGRALASPEGLTLPELQAIGREVGLAPERIAEAAAALDFRRGALPARTQLGMPVSVGRSVRLSRAPTEAEWQTLVGELQATFRARGREWSSGTMRQWTNGNLHAFVETSGDQVNLRLGTKKGDALPVNLMGIGGLALGFLIGGSMFMVGPAFPDLIGPAVLALGGGSALGFNFARLRSWASVREGQFERIAARAVALIDTGEAEQP